MVNIDSSQLEASCVRGISFENLSPVDRTTAPRPAPTITAVLDDDGNATVVVDGIDCAPGTDVIEADLEVAPFLTALTTLVVNPPAVTPVGSPATRRSPASPRKWRPVTPRSQR